jgi:transcription initiation factor IIF auxiliary subunit
MAGYPSTEGQATLLEENGWALVDADTSADVGAIPDVDVQKLGVSVALAYPSIPTAHTKINAVLSVLAPTSQGTERAPLWLVAILDKSGSMQGEKIKLMKETINFMLQHLTDRDALGLVAFDTKVQTLAPLTRCNHEGRAHLEAVVNRIHAGSQTNLSGGLLKGLDLHKEPIRDTAASLRVPQQRIFFGNKYRKLPEEVDVPNRPPPPAGCERVHEWTMELRTEAENAALIQKVVYKLVHNDPDLEVFEPPFSLTRVGWGRFKVQADVHLHDGRVLPLEHELCFDKSETFRTILMPLQSTKSEAAAASSAELGEAEEDQAVVRSTFLFTDGVANVGITNADDICSAMAAMLADLGNKQCTVSTFGFGANHSEDLLKNIADCGNKGVYCFIEDADSIGQAFGEALGGLMSVTHQNVHACLELAPGVTLVKAKTSYAVDGPVAKENGWQSWSIDLGDLYAEERRDILLKLSLPEASADGHEQFGCFHARAFSVPGVCMETTQSSPLLVERLSKSNVVQGDAHPQVQRHRNRYVASEALGAARAAARRGDLSGARKILQAASTRLSASSLAVQGCPLTAALLADVQECLDDLQTEYAYTCSGSKKMAYMEMAHTRQRTCGMSTTQTYCNSNALAMKSLGANVRSAPASNATR